VLITEWRMTRVTSSRVAGKMTLEFQFFSRITGAVELVHANVAGEFLTINPFNSWIPGKLPFMGHGGEVVARSGPFSPSALSGKYGVIVAQEGTSGSLIHVTFSSWWPTVFNWIALAGIVQIPTLTGMLESSVIPFRVV